MVNSAAFAKHDHTKCVAQGLKTASSLCDARRARMTPIRRRVLEILLAEHKAMGAYDVLERLRRDGLADKPPVAYRALNFLVDQGLVHRVEKLNAYVACDNPQAQHQPMFLICDTCQHVAERQNNLVEDLGTVIDAESGFQVQKMVFEAQGLCPSCQRAE